MQWTGKTNCVCTQKFVLNTVHSTVFTQTHSMHPNQQKAADIIAKRLNISTLCSSAHQLITLKAHVPLNAACEAWRKHSDRCPHITLELAPACLWQSIHSPNHDQTNCRLHVRIEQIRDWSMFNVPITLSDACILEVCNCEDATTFCQ